MSWEQWKSQHREKKELRMLYLTISFIIYTKNHKFINIHEKPKQHPVFLVLILSFSSLEIADIFSWVRLREWLSPPVGGSCVHAVLNSLFSSPCLTKTCSKARLWFSHRRHYFQTSVLLSRGCSCTELCRAGAQEGSGPSSARPASQRPTRGELEIPSH